MKDGFFDSKEFASHDGAPSPWGPMNVRQELVDFLNRVRLLFGKPLIVTSGYRSPSRNAHVGGVPNSYHTQGLAADIRPEDQKDLPTLWELCRRLNVTGGVGIYDTFVHVDRRGYAARFDKRTKK
jgi:uncharacterized protein YcbK (DUF882 family)